MSGSTPLHKHEIMAADAAGVAQAVAVLQAGGIVALPTETVYGLAADARNAQAVAAIYATKRRPDFNPLIVHVVDMAAAQEIAQFDARAEALAAAFWPGALTLVLPLRADARIAPAVSAGLATIALRCPAHPVMQSVLRESGLALAAPSANRSGGISPTQAAHVAASLGDRAPLILDGGACAAGLESTIVAVRPTGWQILRPGPITVEAIAAVLGQGPLTDTVSGIEVPGQMASHYAPNKPVRLNATHAGAGEYLIGWGDMACDYNLSAAGDLMAAAAQLYAALHAADASDRAAIAIASIPDSGIGAAINDRLARAAAGSREGRR